MWFTLVKILNCGYHARGTKNDSHQGWSVLVSSIEILIRSTESPGKELTMKLKEDWGFGLDYNFF
jgi:hypothetical protein